MLEVCPTAVVRAPARRVWDLITRPPEIARWSDTRLIAAPGRELQSGDRLVVGAGIGHCLEVVFEVGQLLRPHRVAFRIALPFGVTNDEMIEITRIDDESCRVTFN